MAGRSTRFASLEEPQKRGQATEAILRSELLVRDLPVLIPEYDNEPCDFVVEVDGAFYKIQAKTAYRNSESTVCFETVSTRTRSEGYDRTDYRGKIDYFAVYNPVLDEAYLVKVEQAAKGKMEIRFREAKNGQRTGIKWHADYLIDTVLDSGLGQAPEID